MARPKKAGLDYFPFDVDFFEDRKIKVVKSRFGADGIMVYLYILCQIYKEMGYYAIYDDDFEDVAAEDLNMNREKIGQIIHFLADRSLLDGKLFRSDKVLTSHGIQKRYQEAKKDPGRKNPVIVDPKFWVLNENETQSFIQYTHEVGYSRKNDSYSRNNPPLFQEKHHKEKKSKENERKEKKRRDGDFGELFSIFESCGFRITGYIAQELPALAETYSEEWVIAAIKRAADRGNFSLGYVKGILNNWQTAGAIDSGKPAAKKLSAEGREAEDYDLPY